MVTMVSGPFCPILAKCPVLAVSRGSGGQKPRKVLWSLWSPSCLVIKVLWSGLWSGYGRYGQVGGFWENEVTIATMGVTIGVTIALW